MPFLLIVGLLLAIAVFFALGRLLFQGMVQREIKTLLKTRNTPSAIEHQTYTHADLAGLPAPVQRYLKKCLPEGQPYTQTVHLTQSGTMRLGPDNPWKPFTAEQVFTVDPPGFIWNATLRFLPLIHVATRDKYTGQHGNMLIRLQSAVTIADARDPKIDPAALIRYVAEMMWFPTALVNNPYLRWEPIDATRANAVMNDNGLEVTVTFHFDDNGDIESIFAERYMDVNDTQPTPWYGYIKAYASFDGVRIPAEVEVGWQPEAGYYGWWRGRIEQIGYNTR